MKSCKAGALGAAVVRHKTRPPPPLPAPCFWMETGERSGHGGSAAQSRGDGRNAALKRGARGACVAGEGYGGWEDVALGHMKILVCSSYSGSLATLITNIRIFGDV